MTIRIDNPETERLIQELAQRVGVDETHAVERAVKETLARTPRRRTKEDAESRYEAMTRIAYEMGPLLKGLDMDEEMYGENGLYDRETGLPK